VLDGHRGWFPCDYVEMPHDKRHKREKLVDSGSIILNRKNTKDKLEVWFSHGMRPDSTRLVERNILPTNPAAEVGPRVAVAQKKMEEKRKKKVLGNFLKRKFLGDKEKRKISKSQDSPRLCEGIFGMDFRELLSAEDNRWDVPYIIIQCVEFLEAKGLTTEGIFRISASSTKIQEMKKKFVTGTATVDLSDAQVCEVATLLKLYIRELPEPLITFDAYEAFNAALRTHLLSLCFRVPLTSGWKTRATPNSGTKK